MIANWSLGAGEADYDPYRAGGNAALGGLDEWSQLIAEFTSPAYAPTRSAGDAGSGGGSVPLSFAKKGVLTLATLTRKRLTGPDALDPPGNAGFDEMRLLLVGHIPNDRVPLDVEELLDVGVVHAMGEHAQPGLRLKFR